MTDTQKHPPLSKLKHVGAADVLTHGHLRQLVFQQRPYVGPIFEICGLAERNVFHLGIRVVRVTREEAIAADRAGHIAVRAAGHNHRVGLLPGAELIVLGDCDVGDILIGQSGVEGCGTSLSGHEAGAAGHAVAGEGGLQLGRLPRPVEHVGTGNVDER